MSERDGRFGETRQTETREKIDEKRRVFLMRASAVAAIGVAAPACGPGTSGGGDGGAETGGAGAFTDSGFTVAMLAVGEVKTNVTSTFYVGRDAMGIYAFSKVCTHQACDVGAPNAMGVMNCPCHMSTYSSTGDVLVGAVSGQRNLAHHPVMLSGTGAAAQILVNAGATNSDRTTRVAVA